MVLRSLQERARSRSAVDRLEAARAQLEASTRDVQRVQQEASQARDHLVAAHERCAARPPRAKKNSRQKKRG